MTPVAADRIAKERAIRHGAQQRALRQSGAGIRV
jgi:hypothetical protein